MPAAMTYTSLVADVKKYTERTDDAAVADQIPRLIMLAENRIASDMRTLGSELVVVTNLQIGAPTLAKPSYWRKTISLNITVPVVGRVELFPRPYEYVRNFWPNQALQGVPRFYSEYNAQNFLLAPTPDLAYPMELLYYARLEPLDNSNQVNWYTVNCPQLLLYSTLMECNLFLKNFDKAANWGELYAASLESLKGEDGARATDRTTVAP